MVKRKKGKESETGAMSVIPVGWLHHIRLVNLRLFKIFKNS